MIEKESNTLIRLIERIDNKIDNLDTKIEINFKEVKQDIEDLAIVTAKNVKDIEKIYYKLENEMATKEDIRDMVTKENIKDMVRQSDIADIVRKSDIEYMVTTVDIKDMATKQDIKPIINLIGSYEIRAKNIEDTLLQDHKPRIADLEKAIFAS
jgi:hypothetical protein